MAFCSGCGEKIEDGVQFCSKCGKAVSGVSADNIRQGKKNTLLLAGFIIGIILLIISSILLFAPIFPEAHIYGTPAVNKSGFSLYSDFLKNEESMRSLGLGPLILFSWIVLFICNIVAVILNILAWIMNNVYMTLTTAILYGLSCSFLPMVLCFIAYGQIKKQNKAA